MDSADCEALRNAITLQGQCLGQHEQALQRIMGQLQEISTSLVSLRPGSGGAPDPSPPQVTTPPVPASTSEPHVPHPAKYSGNPDTCREFLTQCRLTFKAQPSRYHGEAAKMAFIVNLLEGSPLSMFNALYEQDSPLTRSFSAFSTELKRLFDFPIRGPQAGQRLLTIRQEKLTVREYVGRFRSLAVESDWNDAALLSAFQSGLNRDVRREVALRGDVGTLDEAILLAIRVSDLEAQWQVGPSIPRGPTRLPENNSVSSLASPTDPEPMQLGRTRLSAAERRRRMDSGACLYCGQEGHFLSGCPLRPKGEARR